MIRAPWTSDQVKKIRNWQNFTMAHPLTCGNDSNHGSLQVTSERLKCLKCDYTQNWVPDCCTK